MTLAGPMVGDEETFQVARFAGLLIERESMANKLIVVIIHDLLLVPDEKPSREDSGDQITPSTDVRTARSPVKRRSSEAAAPLQQLRNRGMLNK